MTPTIDKELQIRAQELPKDKRRQILTAMTEPKLHVHLKELFEAMEPGYLVEITHGSCEFGKDLVMVKSDRLTTDVIGVVVKRGNISGRTLGDVDDIKARVSVLKNQCGDRKLKEIESQISQAKERPAEMPSIFCRLPVTKIQVVLCGKLSGQARRRLELELGSSGEVRDLGWLIDNFTEYYPQVFFHGQSIDFIQAQITSLENRNWLVDRNLSEYFIEPVVGVPDVPVNLDTNLQVILKERRLPFSRLKDKAEKSERILLIGDPGTGKTAALAKLAIDKLRQAYAMLTAGEIDIPKVKVPVFITAHQLLEFESTDALIDSIYGNYEVHIRFEIEALLVDGLDEVPPERRQTVLDKGLQFSQDLSCSLIISSRKISLTSRPPKGLERLELMPLELSQALKLIEKLLNHDTRLIGVLRDGLERIRYQIPIIPLSLVLLLELVQEQKEIPSSVTELYDRFSDAVLGRDDRKKGIEVLFEYLIKKRFLANLAYVEFFKKNRLEIPIADFNDFSLAYCEEYGFGTEQLDDFVEELDRAGILDVHDSVNFVHRSFLEYFAAFYIFQRRDEITNLPSLLVETYYDDIWSEIVFFYTGLKREISGSLLESILSYAEDNLSVDMSKFLIGRLLQAGWHSQAKVKTFGIERAFEYPVKIKKRFIELTQDHKPRVPEILADFLVVMCADEAFRSTFIENELKGFFWRLADGPSAEAVKKMIPALWALRPFLSPDELRDAVNECLTALSKIPIDEQASALILLMVLEQNNKPVLKVLKRRLRTLYRKYPDTLRSMLPEKKKGFR